MKRHRTDGLSLTFGLLFLAIVAWWLVAGIVNLSLPHVGWFVAAALILLGALGLAGALRGGRNRAASRVGQPLHDGTAGPDPDTEPQLGTDPRVGTDADLEADRDLIDGRGEGEVGRP